MILSENKQLYDHLLISKVNKGKGAAIKLGLEKKQMVTT